MKVILQAIRFLPLAAATISGSFTYSYFPQPTYLSVDIYDGSTQIGPVRANQYFGIPTETYYPFSFTIPASLKDNQPHVISVRYGGNDLTGSPQTLQCAAATYGYPYYDPGNTPDPLTSLRPGAWTVNGNYTQGSGLASGDATGYR